ncbi:alpha/beta fold hydrolase [Geomonas subterranea]|uniref:Alpha/beta fold hydrolase n=1 Tax=Geomonas subterranea TaxID=2847989 RepID=A0ABX8LJ93_9BACT|nr:MULTISPECIES: alpha/beta fold hydrolase [Geomonas]QXE91798.1 alpha/beta fold hydrolase [Geomonas subterranea]QXM10109.1 alpha/beta fold hydrolase [Geomonas subterranea]
MKRLLALALLLLSFIAAAPAAAAPPQSYFYPFVNPYEATVMELPKEFEVRLPDKVPIYEFVVRPFPKREIPEVFWYENGLICSLVYQDHKAPLVFLVAGSGSRFDVPRMLKLQKVLYQAGFHVISVTSPTHMDFVVNAARGLPGIATDDAKDLYRVMDLAYQKVRDRVDVSHFMLAGYSLGGFDAAFVARLDDQEHRFNFKRVLLINPPICLYDSVSALDRLLVDNVPGGMDNFDNWFRGVFSQTMQLAEAWEPGGLSGESMYRTYKRMQPSESNLAALIGLTARMNAADMIFTADVMNGGGYIVPRNVRLTSTTSLTRYAIVAYKTSFVDYFEQWLLPHYQKMEPGLTREDLLRRETLRALEGYLKGSNKFGLIHNEDDIILVSGDIEYLERVFGDRAWIFPSGGHMGNMFHPDVVSAITGFLKGKEE